MVSILELLGSDSAGEDLFDVDVFTEMMEAYLPGFAQINRFEKLRMLIFVLTYVHLYIGHLSAYALSQ